MSIYFSAYCFGWSISGSYVLVIVIVLKMISLKYKNEVLIGKMHFNTVIFFVMLVIYIFMQCTKLYQIFLS